MLPVSLCPEELKHFGSVWHYLNVCKMNNTSIISGMAIVTFALMLEGNGVSATSRVAIKPARLGPGDTVAFVSPGN